MKRKTPDKIRFFEFPDMNYVQVVWAKAITNDFPRHIHKTYCIGIIDEGAREIIIKNRSIIIPEKSLFILNPGVPHQCRSFESKLHSYRIICVTTRFMKDLVNQIAETDQPIPYFPDIIFSDERVLTLINKFLLFLKEKKPLMEREEVILALCSRLVLNYAEFPPSVPEINTRQEIIREICKYIEKNYPRDLSLSKIARKAGLSPFHFQRLFLKEIGISPHDYLVQLRIKKARELLLNGLDIIGVALDTGFADQSHFTRCFKKIMGVTPGRFFKENEEVKDVKFIKV
ncbi:MAG: AraC family transcriptional regulator [bacterium]